MTVLQCGAGSSEQGVRPYTGSRGGPGHHIAPDRQAQPGVSGPAEVEVRCPRGSGECGLRQVRSDLADARADAGDVSRMEHRPGEYNGDDSWRLPIPGRFVVDSGKIIRYSEADPDYMIRPEPEETLNFLRGL